MKTDAILLVMGCVVSGLWIMMGVVVFRAIRTLRRLSTVLDEEDLPRSGATEAKTTFLPSCTIVVTARNEEAEIEETVRRFVRQRYDGLEIVVVDDRST